MDFTYYGDLLGISGLYKLNPSLAKDNLNEFYNTVFKSFGKLAGRDKCEVIMFSDSLLIYGNNLQEVLEELGSVYLKLLLKGILLRGAIVYGKLRFEPRFTVDNSQKMLPDDDTLARVVGLSGTQKGVRLVIESDIAQKLLKNHSDWLTHDGYLRSVNERVPHTSVLRRVCPTPDNNSYELLYYWSRDRRSLGSRKSTKQFKAELEEMQKMLREDISDHYSETLSLINRSETRKKYTNKMVKRLRKT